MSIRDRAKQAYLKQEKDKLVQEKERMQARTDLTLSKLRRDWTDAEGFIFEGANITPYLNDVAIDDIYLTLREYISGDWWYLVFECGKCGKKGFSSGPVATLADIGKYLSRIAHPYLCDTCAREQETK